MIDSDGNVSLVLNDAQRSEVGRVLERVVGPAGDGFGLLVDRAGRMVEVANRPAGVALPAIASLAAGCFTATHMLAGEMGEDSRALRFHTGDAGRIYVRALETRALLVGVTKGPQELAQLVDRLDGPAGQRLLALVRGGGSPPAPGAPRLKAPAIPSDVRRQTRALTAFIMDVQATRAEDLGPEAHGMLLRGRDELVRTLSAERWGEAKDACDRLRRWLCVHLDLPTPRMPEDVLVPLYGSLLGSLHRRVSAWVAGGKPGPLYAALQAGIARRCPAVYASRPVLGPDGPDVASAWEAARAGAEDSFEAADRLVVALDALVRALLRTAFVTRGPHVAEELLVGALATKELARPLLLPLGLDTTVGETWTDLVTV